MTVSATDTRLTHAGNGVTTAFSYNRQFQAATDLLVYLVDNTTGVATLQTLSTDYSVTGAGDVNGGTVTMVVAPATGKTLVIYRDTDPTQNLDLDNVTSYPMTSLEAAFDRAMLAIGELKTKLTYAVLAPLTRLGVFDYTLPTPVASKVLGINAAATGFELRSPQIWSSGAGDPSGASGSVGDFYLNTTSADIFEKTGASTWTLRANIRGPAGLGSTWGGIAGTLSAQTDLQSALDAKLDDSQATAFGLSLMGAAAAANARTILNVDVAGTAATEVATHAALPDPHPQYLTPAEGNAAYSLLGHTHTSSAITDFNEAAQDAVGAAFDTTLAYNDAGNSMGRAAITGHISIPAGSNAAVLGSFTKAQLDAAVSDGDVSYVGHTHLLANVTDVTMTVANLNALDDGVNTALHFHDADRARANHTGTQVSTTISDFNEAAQDAVGAAFDTTLAYNDAGNSMGRAAITGHISVPAGSNAAVLGSFTLAQLNAAVSDADVANANHTHSGLAPAGGTTGQVLKKVSNTDYDYSWQADSTGGGGGLADADYGDITVSGGATVFTIDNDVVTNAKLGNMATATIKGRVTAATGDPEDLTGTQATALLDVFTSGLKGLVPASGGGTANFMRADGTWAPPSGASVVGAFKNLRTFNDATNPNFQFDVTVDEIILKDGSGVPKLVSAVSVTADITVAGANGLDTGVEANSTWYHAWLIDNGTTTAALLSLSDTAPTMPSGYTFKALVGAVYNESTGHFRTTRSFGNTVYQTPVQAFSGAGVTSLTSLGLTSSVPPLAVEATGNIYTSANISSATLLAADSGGVFKRYYVPESAGTVTIDSIFPGMEWTMPMFTPQTIWRKHQNTSAGYVITVDRFVLPVAGTAGSGPQSTASLVVTDSNPSTPAANEVKLFRIPSANRQMPAFVGPTGLKVRIQPFQGSNKVGTWSPPGNATTVPAVDAFNAPTALGTATARNVASTNMATRARRLGYVSAATAGSLSGHHNVAAGTQFSVGDGAGLGGFHLVARFVPSDAAAVAGARMFVGLRNAVAAPTNVEPNTLTNAIGVGQQSGSSNLHIFYGGSAAQTMIDLGANFPANGLSTDLYELALFAPPGSNNTVYYQVTRLNTGDVATGTLTGTAGTALPASTTFLGFTAWRTNNATALAVGIDVVSVYIETDN